VFIGRSAESAVAHRVEDVRVDDRRVLVKLASVDDRTTAETLRGMMIFVPESEAAPPPEGSYYIHDLIGCEVRTTAGETVGTLTDIVGTPAQDLWAVTSGEMVHHIPAVKRFIVSVDVGKKVIVVDLPDGLI
jgi:16S rRNA processing protein RimM